MAVSAASAQSDCIQRAIHAAYNKRSGKGIVEVLLKHRLEASPRNLATGLHRLSRLRPECRQLFRSAAMNKVHSCVLRHLTKDAVDPQYVANIFSACTTAEFYCKSLYRYCTMMLRERRLKEAFNGQELSSVLSAVCQPCDSSRGLEERRELLAALMDYMVESMPTMAAPELAKVLYSIGDAHDRGLLPQCSRSKAQRLVRFDILPQIVEIPPELFSPRDVARLLWGRALLPVHSPPELDALLYFQHHIVSLAACGGFSVKALCRLTVALAEVTTRSTESVSIEATEPAADRAAQRWSPHDLEALAVATSSADDLSRLQRLVETIIPFGPSAPSRLVEPFLACCWVLRTRGVRPSRRASAGLLSLFRSLQERRLHAQVMLLCFAWGVYPTPKDFTHCATRLRANLSNHSDADPAYMSLIAKTLAHLCFAAGWHHGENRGFG
ncbi:hypothetical protein FOZ63_014810 [Perkinsus olseni]|uniref:Uncharacterized protein n=2 Tax=Perkinsus olseni TaxID=32597 RepID=A0A7J6Q5M9_PEROL|nr:hypothetical protein FOZ63_014810 [Perkinsus olseni]